MLTAATQEDCQADRGQKCAQRGDESQFPQHDRSITSVLVERYRPQIEAALAHSGGTHTFEDVAGAIERGDAQFWPGPRSVIITQILTYPQKKVVHVFLAGGRMDEIARMTPVIEGWAKQQGCTSAALIGRAGWQRSFLARNGWHTTAVVMEKELEQ